MFTGIILAKGRLQSAEPSDSGLKITVDLGQLASAQINLGDSIAINGTCLTVTAINKSKASFDVSLETLDKCLISQWQIGRFLNLETALTLSTPLGGHLVSGHIDGVGVLKSLVQHDDYCSMEFEVNQDLGKFIATKGSVAVDGISLTTNTVADQNNATQFEVMLVPHTLANTTLGELQLNQQVHIEIDQIARYAERLGQFSKINSRLEES